MNKTLFLCLDQGGSSSRAMVFDSQGLCVAKSQRAVGEQRKGLRVEQSPEQLVSSLRTCANEAVSQLNRAQREALGCCGLISQRSSLVAYNKISSEALSPVLSWQDTRAADHMPMTADDIEHIYRHSGLMVNAHFAASKMCWLLQHSPAVNQAAQNGQLIMAPLASYLVHRLLANKPILIDRGNASRTLLMDVVSGEWSPAMLSLWGLGVDYLPHIVACNASIGELKLQSISLPMQLLTGDQCAAAFGQGLMSPEQVSINMGSGAFLLTPTDGISCRKGLLNSIVHWANKACYSLEGTVNGAGTALATMAASLGAAVTADKLQHYLKSYGSDCENIPLFINSLSGLGSPYWRHDIRAEFISDKNANDEQRLVAVAESIIFLLMRNLEYMRAENPSINRIVVSGGLSQNDGLCQRLCDLSGLPVERCAELEASARGAAFLLAAMPSKWPINRKQLFEPRIQKMLQQRYSQWRECLEQRL